MNFVMVVIFFLCASVHYNGCPWLDFLSASSLDRPQTASVGLADSDVTDLHGHTFLFPIRNYV